MRLRTDPFILRATPFDNVMQWLVESQQITTPFAAEPIENGALRIPQSSPLVPPNTPLVTIPGSACITRTDVDTHDLLAQISDKLTSELIALTMWLLIERSRGAASKYSALIASLPTSIPTNPLTWSLDKRNQLLKGSPALEEANARLAALEQQWRDVESVLRMEAPGRAIASSVPAAVLTRDAFVDAFTVILRSAIYLPAAQCFALVPILSTARRTPQGVASVDYNVESQCVVCRAETTALPAGSAVALLEPMPNAALLLTYGTVSDDNPFESRDYETSLVGSDRLYALKKQVVEQEGLVADKQVFPVMKDRMPSQLYSYLRLARLQDPGDFVKISFSRDLGVVSVNNEYEVLQLLMGDLRELMNRYDDDLEEEMRRLSRDKLPQDELCALIVKVGEKKVLLGAMDAVRRRLAPIRGIPTKSGGLEDPNQDLNEIFQAIESIPNVPKKLFEGIASWARGDNDPEWKKKR